MTKTYLNKIAKCILIVALGATTGCDHTMVEESEFDLGTKKHAIVDVEQTPVERQSIGNCWLYAHASWAESLHKRATGETFDVSQSYWTYLHWFDQIAEGRVKDNELSTGGNWSTVRSIVRNYGLMDEADFVSDDTADEMSYRQSYAKDVMNRALGEGGELESADARQDRKKVRDVLDRAWRLETEVIDNLNEVFGLGMERTFISGATVVDGSPIIHAGDFPVDYTNASANATLQTALSEWRYTSYNKSRSYMKRIQRALHAQEPVMISWFVDFNALENGRGDRRGSFNLQTLENETGPGGQGGHMTVLEDYEALVNTQETIASDRGSVTRLEWHHVEPIEIEDDQIINIQMTGSGDADLYVNKDQQPTSSLYNCRPYANGSDETCQFQGPGQLFISVQGYSNESVFNVAITRTSGSEVLKAGITLDPEVPEDAAKLAAVLDDQTEIIFLRTKNSWGSYREGRSFALDRDGNPFEGGGYHDLYMDYLNGPVVDKENCDDSENPTWDTCDEPNRVPFAAAIFPPGF